ncbi:MAG: hypothetical protein HQK50_00415 [Oligoflexia bacterium]|nr:hypothetical protein [Oligoflexia bacterium]MBF0363998.1 hypothetical protein [Oligoflexia bacterium]
MKKIPCILCVALALFFITISSGGWTQDEGVAVEEAAPSEAPPAMPEIEEGEGAANKKISSEESFGGDAATPGATVTPTPNANAEATPEVTPTPEAEIEAKTSAKEEKTEEVNGADEMESVGQDGQDSNDEHGVPEEGEEAINEGIKEGLDQDKDPATTKSGKEKIFLERQKKRKEQESKSKRVGKSQSKRTSEEGQIFESEYQGAQLTIEDQEKKLSKMKSFDQEDNLFISEKNLETGLLEKVYSIGEDKNHWNLFFQTNASVIKGPSLLAGDFLYGRNLDFCWLETAFSIVTAHFSALSTIPGRRSDNNYAEVNSSRSPDSAQLLFSASLGPGYRFRFPEEVNILQIQNLFQNVAVYLSYNRLLDSVRDAEYDGFGFRADYGVHKRLSTRSHIGARFAYHFAEVSRPEMFSQESGKDRRLYLSWFTLGLDLAVYY